MKHFLIGIRSILSAAAILLFAVPVLAFASVSVSIQALSPSNIITVGQGVTFEITAGGFVNPTYAISDSLNNSTISNGDIDSSGNFSWTPNNSDIGTHNLTITVSDSLGDNATANETITVTAPASMSLGSVWPGANVTVGSPFSFSASVTGFTSPTYSLSDSFSGSTISNADINSYGDFSWTPSGSSQDGSHTITVYATDNYGHSASASETVNVQAAPTVVIGSISPSATVTPGQTVTFAANASNFSSPSYSLSDSFGGTSITNADINSSGNVTWTPEQSDDGNHTITVLVTDSEGHNATASTQIQVGGTPLNASTAIQGLSPGSSVAVGQPVTFTVAASGFVNPVFSIGDSFGAGSSISNSDINSGGSFTWTPDASDVGTHNLTIYINDSLGHTGNVTQSLTVSEPNIAITSIEPATTVSPGAELTFTVSPVGFTNPSYTVSDSFSGTSVVSSDINSSGDFVWTPTQNDDGMHTITVSATDSSGHSANTSIVIDVTPVSAVTPTVTTSATSLGQLEAELQQDEAAIAGAGGNVSGATTSYVFGAAMSQGMTSSEVTQLQTVLQQQGYLSVSPTGYYGSLTTAAVEKFQAAHGIAQVGSVGPLTMAALNALMVTPSSSTSTSSSATVGDGYVFSSFIGLGDSGTGVTELQKRLTALGVYSGPVTGYFGSLTQTAVETFQGDHGIAQVGYVGPSTRTALNQ